MGLVPPAREAGGLDGKELVVKPSLEKRLRERRVRVQAPDEHTLLLRDVPVNSGFFSKPRTNMLLKRLDTRRPFIVFVDEDLEYTGPDDRIALLFVRGVRRNGWKAAPVTWAPPSEGASDAALEQALESALAAVGFDGQDPTMPAGSEPANGAAENGLLASCGSRLSERARSGGLAPVVGRQEEIETVLACVSRWSEARLAVIAGESGVGKTNLLHGVAGLLAQRRPAAELIRVDLARAFAGSLFNAEGENLLRTLLDDALASEDTILALENLHLVLGLDQGPLLVTGALDRGARLIGVILSRYVHALLRPPLARRLQLISLPESTPEETIAILDRLRASIAERHGVTIDPACVRTTVRASADLPGRYPAKAVSVLDAAASSAALLGLKAVCADSIYHAATQAAAPAL